MLAAAAADEMLVRAAASNQTAWMARIAEAAGGVVTGSRRHLDGVTCGCDSRLPRRRAAASMRCSGASSSPLSAPGGLLLVASARAATRSSTLRLRGSRFPRGLAGALDCSSDAELPRVREPAGVRVAVAERTGPDRPAGYGAGIAASRRLATSRPLASAFVLGEERARRPCDLKRHHGRAGCRGSLRHGRRGAARGVAASGARSRSSCVVLGRECGLHGRARNATPEGELLTAARLSASRPRSDAGGASGGCRA